MFLARVEGTVVAATKHPTLAGCRFLVARRLEADGAAAAEPNVVVDWLGATRGNTVMVSTDGDIARERFGSNTPARMVVVGIVDAVQPRDPSGRGPQQAIDVPWGGNGRSSSSGSEERVHAGRNRA